MSKDIVVLTPNARRVMVHCTADTSILQILEDVCRKHGLQPSDYDLKHHNKVLDLSTTIRFSNLPNKACLEMVDIGQQRIETNVTIGLQLEDGERRTGEFSPNTSLYDVICSLAAKEMPNIQFPTVLYMRQEINGFATLKEKTLRHLGLLGGRAILRLLNRAENEFKTQANVSCALKPRPQPKSDLDDESSSAPKDCNTQDKKTRNTPNPLSLFKQFSSPKRTVDSKQRDAISEEENVEESVTLPAITSADARPSDPFFDTKQLERRLNIEDEVTFVGAQKAIAFAQPNYPEQTLEDLPDDFYELTIDEIRRLYRDLQVKRSELEEAPLLTATKRQDKVKQQSEIKLNIYKNVVVRIQFPDNIILQGVFQPTNTMEDITNFVKQHLRTPEEPFNIFTTAMRGNLQPQTSLLEANLVPCVHFHFKWIAKEDSGPCLQDNIYSNITSSDAASILASKYRAPSRRKLSTCESDKATASTSKNNKVPKWFK